MTRDREVAPVDQETDEEFHFFQGLPDNFNRRIAEYLDSDESTTACLLVDHTLNGIVHNDFFPAWQHRLLSDFKIPFDISNTFQSPHIVYRRLKILSRQIYDPEFNLYQKIRYAFSAPRFSPFTMPWLFYPFNCDANKDFISQLNKDGPAFQEYYLQMACRVGNLAFVQFLCENNNFKLNLKHLNYACTSGNKHLVKYCTDVHKNNLTIDSLNNAVCSGNVELVDYFLNTVQIEANNYTYLVAELSGNRMILRLLMNKYGNNDFEVLTCMTRFILRSGIIAEGDQLAHMQGEISQVIDTFLSEKTMTLIFVRALINQAQFIPTLKTFGKALKSGDINLVLFLDHEIRKSQGNFTYHLSPCAITGDIDFVKQVISLSKENPDIYWLRNAIFSGNIELVKFLMQEFALDPKKIDFSLDGLGNKHFLSQFLFCHIPMAQFLIEELGCVPIESEFENYIQGNNLPVARYLMTQCKFRWGEYSFPNTFYYTDSLTKNVIDWCHAEDEARRVDCYEGQMPFISLVASACGQDPQNPLLHEVEEDWDLIFKKAFLKTYEFDGYDSTSKEYIPAFPDDSNQKYTFDAKNLTFWTALTIFFGIPNRPEKGSKEGTLWTWRQYIRNFFGGWNPILFDDKTDEDNIEGKVLLNLMLIIIPVKISIALFKLVTIIFKTGLNTLKLFIEFLPLLGYKIIKKRGVNNIVTYGFLPTIAPRIGFFSRMYYKARYYLAIFAFLIVFAIICSFMIPLRVITSPEKSVRSAWAEGNAIKGGPIEKVIFGSLIGLLSLTVTITLWSAIVAALWFLAIPILATQFPMLVSVFIGISHFPLVAPALPFIHAKIMAIWGLYSYLTIPLLVAPTTVALTLFSRLSDVFSNAWAQWIPQKQNLDNQAPAPAHQLTQCNDAKTNKLKKDINNSNINPRTKDLVAETQAASQEAQYAEINVDRRSVEIASEPINPSANTNTSSAASEHHAQRMAIAPG